MRSILVKYRLPCKRLKISWILGIGYALHFATAFSLRKSTHRRFVPSFFRNHNDRGSPIARSFFDHPMLQELIELMPQIGLIIFSKTMRVTRNRCVVSRMDSVYTSVKASKIIWTLSESFSVIVQNLNQLRLHR